MSDRFERPSERVRKDTEASVAPPQPKWTPPAPLTPAELELSQRRLRAIREKHFPRRGVESDRKDIAQ